MRFEALESEATVRPLDIASIKSIGAGIEQLVDLVRTAAPNKLFLARWAEEEWAAY